MSVVAGASIDRFNNQQSLQKHEQTMARGSVPARKTAKPQTAKQFAQQQKANGAMRDPHGVGNTGEVAKQRSKIQQGSSVNRFHKSNSQQQAQARTQTATTARSGGATAARSGGGGGGRGR